MTVQYFIVGTKHRGPEAEKMLAEIPEGEPLELVREPTNRFDTNAVQVIARGVCIGYVRATQSAELAYHVDHRGMALDSADPSKKQMTGVFARTANSKVPVALLPAAGITNA